MAGRSAAKSPVCTAKTLSNANAEYSHLLDADTKYFTIQCRTAYDCRFAFVTGKVAASTDPFMTLKSGVSYSAPENWENSGLTLYLASTTAGVVVEILEWK